MLCPSHLSCRLCGIPTGLKYLPSHGACYFITGQRPCLGFHSELATTWPRFSFPALLSISLIPVPIMECHPELHSEWLRRAYIHSHTINSQEAKSWKDWLKPECFNLSTLDVWGWNDNSRMRPQGGLKGMWRGRAVLFTVGCLAASPASTNWMPTGNPSCDNHMCVLTLSKVPWRANTPGWEPLT